MKKITFSLIIALCLLLTPFAAFADAEPKEYTDDTANVTFTVPAGWSRVSQAETDSILYAFQKDGDEKQQFFGYTVADIYDGSSESFKKENDRSSVNNSIMTKEEFEEKMIGKAEDSGIQNPKVESETVGKYDFFRLTFTQKVSEESTVNVVLYAHIVNGYGVYFRFQTYDGAPDEEDIKAVISSVNFADETGENKIEPKTEAEKTTGTNTEKKSSKSGTSKRAYLGVGLALLAAILGFIGRKLRKK